MSSIGDGGVGEGGRAVEGEAEVSESNAGSGSAVRARQAMLYSKREAITPQEQEDCLNVYATMWQ